MASKEKDVMRRFEPGNLDQVKSHQVKCSAGRFIGILIYRGVIIAPVQRFYHNSTGYYRIPPDIK